MSQSVGEEGKPLRVVTPAHGRQYPCFKRVQLASVKRGIFHPTLPTLRRMDMDDVLCKLSDEHCRTSTCCVTQDFKEAEMTALMPAKRQLHCLDITECGRNINRYYFNAEEMQRQALLWSRYISDPSYLYTRKDQRRLFDANMGSSNVHFDGVALRRMKPDNRSWRLKFKCEPRLDPNGYPDQQPVPIDALSRHRKGKSSCACK